MTTIKEALQLMYDAGTRQIRELFDYRDGNLYWKVARQGVKIGYPAGYVNPDGYRRIKINGKNYLSHRLIFLYHYGYIPEFLDHIDGNKSNNRIDNLREATVSQNGMNQKKQKSHNGKPTSSRFKGVTWSKKLKKWAASIRINGKLEHLGFFRSEIGAAESYNVSAIKSFGKFANLNDIYSQSEQ